MRSTARSLDYLAYGLQLRDRSLGISKSVIKLVGDRGPGEVLETEEA